MQAVCGSDLHTVDVFGELPDRTENRPVVDDAHRCAKGGGRLVEESGIGGAGLRSVGLTHGSSILVFDVGAGQGQQIQMSTMGGGDADESGEIGQFLLLE